MENISSLSLSPTTPAFSTGRISAATLNTIAEALRLMQMVNKKVQAENGAQALTAEDFSALNSVEMSLERVMLNKARANSVTTPSTPMDRDVLPDVRSFRQLPLEHKNRSPYK